jgi:hypothetical protein
MKLLLTRSAVQVGLVAVACGVLAQVLSHGADAVLAFWDAQAHLDIARRVLDATTPGLQMLGTVWLPVPHLLYLPFTLVDAWWWNGLAGGIVGLIAFVVTAVSMHDLAVRRGGTVAGWVAAVVVICNPSLLYLQTTAMTEPLLLAFLTASVACLDRWWLDTTHARALAWAGIFAALAVGSRYDGWFYMAVAGPMVLWHGRNLRSVLQFALFPTLMVAAWLLYNWHYFGDPLEFQRGIWSAASQQAELAERGLLPTRGHPLLATAYYLGAAALTVGGAFVLAAMPGIGVALHRRVVAPVVLLGSALCFNVISLWAGQSVIALPFGDTPGVMNLRYGVMVLPLVALAVALLTTALASSKHRIAFLSVLVLGQVVLWTWRFPEQVGALREGLAIRDGDRVQMDASIWLAGHYDRGRVLVAPAVNVSPRSRIAMRDRIYPWSWELGPAALADPAGTVDWVIVDTRNGGDPVTQAVAADTTFRRHFLRAFERQGLEIWQRR